MVGVFCRGVCVRGNLVIRIMCHQANDDSRAGWHLIRRFGSSALKPHTGVSSTQVGTRKRSTS